MANHKSAIKRHRQSLNRRDRNRSIQTRVRNVVKAVRTAVDAKDKDTAITAMANATKVIDKAATKKVLHWRCAARTISRLQLAVNKLA